MEEVIIKSPKAAWYKIMKLWISDLMSLTHKSETDNFYLFRGIEVRTVEILGVVVDKFSTGNFNFYNVDDGTGVIKCKIHDNDLKNDDQERALRITSKFAHNENQDCTPEELEALKWLMKPVMKHYERKENGFQIGDTVVVQGTITEYNERLNLKVYSMWAVDDVNYEAHRTLQMHRWYEMLGACRAEPVK